ncbi:MAG TPA: outer membrane protein assembly factor BamD [Acidobacteriaceae bacterium]|jgi:TolA-binding protein|nr:outer membrane protein assembly factor BamD [Acidobacteriaceae bacterium]
MSRSRLVPLTLAALLLFGAAVPPAHAVNKDLIQLQAQVQQLQDALARLQQSNDESMGVLKSLVQQTADAVNKMTVTVNALQLRMQNQETSAGQSAQQLSGQVQSLNDSLDELKARMDRMQKALNDIQSAQQTTNAALGNLPQATGTTAAPAATAPAGSSAQPAPGTPLSALTGGQNQQALPVPPPVAGPSAGDLYRAAYGDYMAGKYTLATSEFQELIKAYPDDNLSGNGYFYIGEMDLRSNKPSAAIHDYDHVLEHYPDNSKIPAAHLHKGDALIATRQTEAGIREFRSLIQRFPNSPEADQARAKLSTISRR